MNDESVDVQGSCALCDKLRGERPARVVYARAPRLGGGWPEWAVAVEGMLRAIGHGPTNVVLITQDVLTQRYVQLLIGHGVAHAEASSNAYLRGSSRLAADQERLLGLLGWSAPTRRIDRPGDMPTNWALPPFEGAWDELVEVLLATIVGVFGFNENVPVIVTTFMADHPCPACFPTVPS